MRKRKGLVRKANAVIPAAGNMADDVVQVLSMLNSDSHPFVQSVHVGRGKSPCVLLYTEHQLSDMRRFCCQGSDGAPQSVLGVDRTFNLGPCFVTVIVYTCKAVVRNDTRSHPTFVGPMFLHWDGQYLTYRRFFSEVQGLLDNDVSSTEVRLSASAVIGSDEEKGLTKALRDVFSGSTHLLCVKHLRDNIIDYMRNKCGVQQSIRNRLVSKMFDDDGLINADDSVAYSQAADSLASECETVSSTLGEHFRRHVEPALRRFVFEPRQQHPWVSRRWTNNAAESMNHLLKLSIDWHPRRLPELVDRLYKVTSVQMSDLRRALYGHGNYTLTAPYNKFSLPHTSWQSKSPEVYIFITIT